VFISYSHEPPENAEFVRDLAGWLKMAGNFEVWLDEEEIPAAAQIELEIKKAIEESEVGLFIVTSRWMEREWTQHEVRLFARRADSRRLVVSREEVDLGDLGPHLSGLKVVTWAAGDDDRDARHWEIYCGITNTKPGPREQWAQKARSLSGGPWNLDGSVPPGDIVVPAHSPKTKTGFRSGERLSLPCTGQPVACVVGERWTFIVTDQKEWVGITPEGELHPALTRLSDHANAAFSANHELLVGICEPMVVRLRGQRWEYLPQEAPVLCFGNSAEGDIAGTTAGGLVVLNASSPVPAFRIRDPVAALASFDGGLVVLGSRGIFGRLSWPIEREEALTWINTDKLGRPVGLFRTVEYDHVGVYSATRIGVLDPSEGNINVCDHPIKEGIREVVFLGARSKPYAVLTDEGGLMLLDAGLGSVRSIRFPRNSFVLGCCNPSLQGEIHAWTSEGELYSISTGGSVEEIAGDGVALAYRPHSLTGALHVVRWNPETGASVERLISDEIR
jgi:hypothetical protein